MTKLRKYSIVSLALLSFLSLSFGMLSRLEHWPYSVFYISVGIGLVLLIALLIIVLWK